MICRPDLRFLLAAAALLALGGTAAGAPARDAIAEAAAALDRGDGIAAEIAAGRALDAGAPRSEVAALLGEAALQQGDLAEARRWLEPAGFAAAQRERGFRALARLEIAEGNLPAAGRALDSAFAAGSGSARLWVDVGRLRYLAGQHDLALAAAAKAIELDPHDPRALEFRGQLVRDAHGPAAALPWFERALDRAPDDLDLLGEYAATLGEIGRNRDMLRIARRMVELDPRRPRAYYLQAVLAARAGRDDLARRLLWRTGGTYDDTPAGMLFNGILELRTGTPALAADRFDALLRRQPDNALAARLLWRALLADNRADEVAARFARTADRPDAPPYVLALVGRAFEQLGRREAAATYLDRAAAPPPSGIGVLASDEALRPPASGGLADGVHRLRQLLNQDQRQEALALAGQLSRHYPGSADVAILTGDVALMAGDAAAALARYRRAGVVRRDFALVRRMVAAQRLLGQERGAMQLVADYLAQNPRSSAAAATLGRTLAERGDWRRAAVLLGHARRLGGDGDPRLLADLAEAQLAAYGPDAARDAARRAYALQRSSGRVAAVLARVMQAGTGSGREADALLAKAQQPPSPAVLAQR